jgi:haloalkane dehalogenase
LSTYANNKLSEANPSFAEKYVSRERGRIYVRDYEGTEPAFVLMHGFPDNLQIYDYLIPELVASGRRVVTFDFLGFGRSDKPTEARYSFEQQLGDLTAVIDSLRLGAIVPVVHDASGPAGLNFAIDHPHKVASIVILNCGFDNSPTARWPELIQIFANSALKDLAHAVLQSPEQFTWLLNFQRATFRKDLEDKHKARYDTFLGGIIDHNFLDVPSAAPAFAQMTARFYDELTRNTSRLAKLKELSIPAKIIWGENDVYINVGVAQHYQNNLSNASLKVIAAGHWLQIDEPALVAKEMLS